MEPFIEMFFSIDKSRNEVITHDELTRYVRDNHLDPEMIPRWHQLFDPQNTGEITFANFCKALALKPEETRVKRADFQASAPTIHPDVQIIRTNMSTPDQIDVTEAARQITKSSNPFDPDYVSHQIKELLDHNYGPKWHVLIAKGSYWIAFSHCPNTSLLFRMYGHTYLIWRTPDVPHPT